MENVGHVRNLVTVALFGSLLIYSAGLDVSVSTIPAIVNDVYSYVGSLLGRFIRDCRENAELSPNGGCICRHGFVQDGNICKDQNECDEWKIVHLCGLFGNKCINRKGGYECQCKKGYKAKEGEICTDVDECQYHACKYMGSCTNTPGSFKCTCYKGYTQNDDNITCKDIDECDKSAQCEHGVCKNTLGTFICVCDRGYSPTFSESSCQDNDECIWEPDCGSGGLCINTLGSYFCKCRLGYTLDNVTGKCNDVNECSGDTNICGNGGVCVNTDGSYRCKCFRNYENVDQAGTRCEDINECDKKGEENPCSPGTCYNIEGAYACSCPEGFKQIVNRNGGVGCADIDECRQDGQPPCYPGTICTNVPGSYGCLCPRGTEPYIFRKNQRECYDVLRNCDPCVKMIGYWGFGDCDPFVYVVLVHNNQWIAVFRGVLYSSSTKVLVITPQKLLLSLNLTQLDVYPFPLIAHDGINTYVVTSVRRFGRNDNAYLLTIGPAYFVQTFSFSSNQPKVVMLSERETPPVAKCVVQNLAPRGTLPIIATGNYEMGNELYDLNPRILCDLGKRWEEGYEFFICVSTLKPLTTDMYEDAFYNLKGSEEYYLRLFRPPPAIFHDDRWLTAVIESFFPEPPIGGKNPVIVITKYFYLHREV